MSLVALPDKAEGNAIGQRRRRVFGDLAYVLLDA
jgi:hypothetical protein